jgi:hypothetical protein
MKKVSITLQIAQPLKERLEALARYEERTAEMQALRLIEEVLRFFEAEDGPGGSGVCNGCF